MALKVGGITRAMVRASGEPATWYRVVTSSHSCSLSSPRMHSAFSFHCAMISAPRSSVSRTDCDLVYKRFT